MASRYFGAETEYAVSRALADDGPDPLDVCQELMQLARQRLPYLAGDESSGIFLSNGSRLYEDAGGHAELATCEVDSPDDIVRYTFAGDAIVAGLADEIRHRASRQANVIVSKCNVDYAQPGVCWGAHESYGHRADPRVFPSQIIPHLVSRIYCGAGGLNPLCPGIQFSLSPRAHMFCKPVSSNTTSDRGIFNTRDEPLSRSGMQRLHVIAGDSLNSQFGIWLKMASTAMVVALIEANLQPADGIQLCDPVAAMHAFAADPYFHARAQLADGRRLGAIAIQRHYLAAAARNIDHPSMPPWSAIACDRWAAALDLLEQGPAAVAGMFDWSTKYPLFLAHARRRGVDPDSFPHWNQVLTSLRDHLRSLQLPDRFTADQILNRPGPLDAHIRLLSDDLKSAGLAWHQVDSVLNLRAELCEIDVRFGHISPRGLFAAVQTVSRPRWVEWSVAPDPCAHPPKTTRARIRGAAVRRYAGQRQVVCDWDRVRNGRRFLDLSDVSGHGARWKCPQPPAQPSSPSAPTPMQRLMQVSRERYDHYFARGEYDRAFDALCDSGPWVAQLTNDRLAPSPLPPMHDEVFFDFLVSLSRVHSHRGCTQEAVNALDRCARLTVADSAGNRTCRGIDFRLAAEYVNAYRHQPLVPCGPELWRWISIAEELRSPTIAPFLALPFLGNKAYALSRAGRDEEARILLNAVLLDGSIGEVPSKARGRLMADHAEILRRLGRANEAVTWLDRAEAIQTTRNFFGDQLNDTNTYRFKLNPPDASSAALLKRTKRVQAALGCRVGLARSLLLDARWRPGRACGSRRRCMILRLTEEIPDLIACPTLTNILEHWKQWTDGSPDPADPNPARPDPFWGI